ncbi:MAG TPA: hypothetical protein VF234_11025 [Limnochordia bacterium]
MRTLSIEELKSCFAYSGQPIETDDPLGELRWRLYQWKRLGLSYWVGPLDRLEREGQIEACFLFETPALRPPPDDFVPEPFPVPAGTYDHWAARARRDWVGFLSVLAEFKLAHEHGEKQVRFASSDQYGQYCAWIDRFYAPGSPYKGKRVYWILFSEAAVDFFSSEYDLAPELLARFMASADRRA